MVALPRFNWSCNPVMSPCFFSSSALRGANFACRSFAAFWPSLVLRIASCTWITPIFAGAWAWAARAAPNASAGITKFLFKLNTPKSENTSISNRPPLLKRPAHREPEQGVPFKVWIRPAVGRERAVKGGGIREHGAVRNYGRLDIFANVGGIIGKINPERRLHDR